jgi:hypothetical protein
VNKDGTDEKSVIVDSDAEALLDELKNKKVPAKLNENTNIFKFDVQWRNNGIDSDTLNEYLITFGEIFYQQIKRLVDEAVFREVQKEKLVSKVYMRLGVIESELDLGDSYGVSKQNEMLVEFKELMTELGLHANEYNVTISKFFGRDDLMMKVKHFLEKNFSFC